VPYIIKTTTFITAVYFFSC